jgi:hypothetical protein
VLCNLALVRKLRVGHEAQWPCNGRNVCARLVLCVCDVVLVPAMCHQSGYTTYRLPEKPHHVPPTRETTPRTAYQRNHTTYCPPKESEDT